MEILLRSKSDETQMAPRASTRGEDPAAEGSQVAADWHGSVESLISACVRIQGAVLVYRNSPGQLEAFLTALVDGRVLREPEAKLGLASPKLSKLIKIGKR